MKKKSAENLYLKAHRTNVQFESNSAKPKQLTLFFLAEMTEPKKMF